MVIVDGLNRLRLSIRYGFGFAIVCGTRSTHRLRANNFNWSPTDRPP